MRVYGMLLGALAAGAEVITPSARAAQADFQPSPALTLLASCRPEPLPASPFATLRALCAAKSPPKSRLPA